jgi:hypothetical protein
MLFWPPYPWYVEPPTNSISNPYPWDIENPSHGISNPLPMAYRFLYPWYIGTTRSIYHR